jgi:hypothetical protein
MLFGMQMSLPVGAVCGVSLIMSVLMLVVCGFCAPLVLPRHLGVYEITRILLLEPPQTNG